MLEELAKLGPDGEWGNAEPITLSDDDDELEPPAPILARQRSASLNNIQEFLKDPEAKKLSDDNVVSAYTHTRMRTYILTYIFHMHTPSH
jgi:hypothetical protein